MIELYVAKYIIHKIVSYTTWHSEDSFDAVEPIKFNSSAFIPIRAEWAGDCSNH